jgi:transposase-like protein
MGQILHGSATTTHAIRAAIQRSKAPLKELAAQHGLNQKTVAKWRKRNFVHDAPMGPKTVRSTVLSAEEEAMVVAFRKHTLLPLDDCLFALQATIPHLTCQSARKTDPGSASNFDPLVVHDGERRTGWSWLGLRRPVGRVDFAPRLSFESGF